MTTLISIKLRYIHLKSCDQIVTKPIKTNQKQQKSN